MPPLNTSTLRFLLHRILTILVRYVVEFVDYSEKQATDKEHVRVPKSEQVRPIMSRHNLQYMVCDVYV
jgi:hypothetical protein